MNQKDDAAGVSSIEDLFAIAYQIEIDAVARYEVLAGQMETHNNAELANVFRDLARAEGIHAQEIRRMAGPLDLEAHTPPISIWDSGESPESADLGAAHYLMTRAEALQMALLGEGRALAFFRSLADTVTDPAMRELASKFAEEETEHVELCQSLIRKYGDAIPREDSDPAISQG
jgi:rubrerythrin